MSKDITLIASTTAGIAELEVLLADLKKDNANSLAQELVNAASSNICGWFHYNKTGLYDRHFRNNEVMIVLAGGVFDKYSEGERSDSFSGDFYTPGDVLFPKDIIGALNFAKDTKVLVVRGPRDNWWEHHPDSMEVSYALRQTKLINLKKLFYTYMCKSKKEDRIKELPDEIIKQRNITLIGNALGCSSKIAAQAVEKYERA